MIVVLSDLHFSETKSSHIGGFDFSINLPAGTFQAYFEDINQAAVDNAVQKLDIVLAGDILEISRSGLWLEGTDRPYIENQEVLPNSSSEQTILKIIKAINQEKKVAETLALIRNIKNVIDCEVEVHYLLGNHDRLVNATPQIRQVVRQILGLEGGDSLFNHRFIGLDDEERPFCLIRHGHEYDPMNFSIDTLEMEEIPTDISENVYGRACLGDIMTIEFGGALPRYFIEEYGEEVILKDETLFALYKRLIAFDDVRPTTALLAFLFSTPGVKKEKTWELMEPCFSKAIKVLSANETFRMFLKNTINLQKGQRVLLYGILDSGLTKNGIPYWMIKQLMKRVSKSMKLKSQLKWAKHESLILNKESGCKCVISGHTHFPEMSLISARKGDERYYINTGTWRNLIPATKDFKEFGTLASMTNVIVFRPKEKPSLNDGLGWSFKYLSGVSFGRHQPF